jgi:RNA polymerase sigma factor (sigma-70 family)
MSSAAPEPDDAYLIAAALAGLPEAFGTLVERYDRAVYHLCLRTMRDAEEARDCTQEAFFKAFRSLRTFKPEAKFSTWIFSIAYHACCDRLARGKPNCPKPPIRPPGPKPSPSSTTARAPSARQSRPCRRSIGR